MIFYWMRHCANQEQLALHWKKGKNNLANYFTKYDPSTYHFQMMLKLMASNILGLLQHQMRPKLMTSNILRFIT